MSEKSIGEAVKLRRRASSNARVLKEIAAVNEEAQRWKRKLDKRKRKREKLSTGPTKSNCLENVSLSTSAATAEQFGYFRPQEFALPDTFTVLKPRTETVTEQSDSSLFGVSQLLDLINGEDLPKSQAQGEECKFGRKRKRLELEIDSNTDTHLLYSENSDETKSFCVINATELSLWIKDKDKLDNIYLTSLERRFVTPVLISSSETLTVLDVFTEGNKVKLFSFSVPRHGGMSAVSWSKTSDLLSESEDIQELYCLKVEGENIVIFYNVNGHSRGHLLTFVENRMEVKFLGNVEAEVRKLSYLHGADNMFLSLYDTSLNIWNLENGKCLSKPMLPPQSTSLVTGALMISNYLICVNYDGKSVIKLFIVENRTYKELTNFPIGDHSFENLTLVAAKKHVLTFVTGSEAFHLNLNTSKINFEHFHKNKL